MPTRKEKEGRREKILTSDAAYCLTACQHRMNDTRLANDITNSSVEAE
jgi:hypothetical protein